MQTSASPTLTTLYVVGCSAFLALATPAFASDGGGTSFPWDSGLNAITSNLTGPVAKAAVLAGMAVTGYRWIFNQHNEGGQMLTKVLFGGACCVFATQMLSSLQLSGAII